MSPRTRSCLALLANLVLAGLAIVCIVEPQAAPAVEGE